jgi:hypothetical protein
VSVSDGERAFKKSRLLHPGGSGHFAVSVLRVPAGIDGLIVLVAAGKDYGYTGAHRASADHELAFTADKSGVSYFHSFYVGDGVEWPGCAVEGHTKVAGALRPSSGADHEDGKQ